MNMPLVREVRFCDESCQQERDVFF
jgi:hypothetical protein